MRHGDSEAELDRTAWWFSGTDRLAFPRRGKSFAARVGLIGSEDLYQALLPECDVQLMTRANWRLLIRLRMVDLILVELGVKEATGDWDTALMDWRAGDAEFGELIQAARRRGLATFGWITSDVAYFDLLSGFARFFDRTFCSDPRFAERLAPVHETVELLPLAIQPSIHNPFLDLADRDKAQHEILFAPWTSILANEQLARDLHPLAPSGLTIVEPKGLVRAARRTAWPALAKRVLGSVGRRDMLLLMKGARILLQADDGLTPRHAAERAAVEAAACGCLVLHCGTLAPDDTRLQFARSFDNWPDLRAFVARLQTDTVLRARLAQLGWRHAQEHHAMAGTLSRILAAAGLACEIGAQAASIVTPTFRPERLPATLAQFRKQSWRDKELIIVANANDPGGWDTGLVEAGRREQIVFLPRDNWAGAALNIGARRSTGDYIFRMDDDDYYGENYVKDMMLTARCTDADVISKQGEFFFSEKMGAIFRRLKHTFRSTYLPAGSFSYDRTPMTGFAMTLRREVALERGYPELAYGFADTGFLMRERDRNELSFVVADNMNAVVERRADPKSHTWQLEHKWEDGRYQRLSCRIEDLMV